MEQKVTFNYAASYFKTQRVLCNNVPKIDNRITESWIDEEGNVHEYFQYFITDLSDTDIMILQKRFPELHYQWSRILECVILCVDFFGVDWDNVMTTMIID